MISSQKQIAKNATQYNINMVQNQTKDGGQIIRT